jgi:tellurite resistance protein
MSDVSPPHSKATAHFSKEALRDVALLALVIAHGADADLDPREIDAIADRLLTLDDRLSGDDVIVVFRDAACEYADMKVVNAEVVVARLADALNHDDRRRAFAMLRAVAEADGVMHPMESAFLRHVAQAWEIGPAFVQPSPDVRLP